MKDTIVSSCNSIGIKNDETVKLVKNCVRLTLALCARTYQLEDTRGRWNEATRSDVYKTLVTTKIENNMWFDLLKNKIPDVMGKMAPFLTSKDSNDLTKELKRRTTASEIINTT